MEFSNVKEIEEISRRIKETKKIISLKEFRERYKLTYEVFIFETAKSDFRKLKDKKLKENIYS